MRRPLSILALIPTVAIGAVACTPAPTTDWSQCPTASGGQVQVAVVVADATPDTRVVCVVVPAGSNGIDALSARAARIGIAGPRLETGSGGVSVCGIDGTPAGGPCFKDDGNGNYSYWAYWTGGTTWAFAEAGAGARALQQGDVDAWTYGSWGWPLTPPSTLTALPSSFAELTS